MRKNGGFKEGGNWYKGNLHSHTVDSDGCLTPVEAVELFRKNGYSFLGISDHDVYSDYSEQFNRDDFIIIPAVESSAVLWKDETYTERLKVHHVHGILGPKSVREQAALPLMSHGEAVTPRLFFGGWDGAAVTQEMSDYLRSRGCLTIYNHPIWSRVREEEFAEADGLLGLEIFNYNTVNESGTGYDTTYWDAILRRGKQIYAFAADDNHNEGFFDDACGGFIMVKAPALTHEMITCALMEGEFYASSGPMIYDWGVDGNRAWVKCSPVYRINFIAGGPVNAGRTVMCGERENGLSEASVDLNGRETYVRIECVDVYGRTAWSNALFLNGPEK